MNRLYSWISFFESTPVVAYWSPMTEPEKGRIVLPSVSYSDEFIEFVRTCQIIGITNFDYISVLEQYGFQTLNESCICRICVYADLQLCIAMLAWCLRRERFFEGAWAIFVSNGVFLSLLNRIKKLTKKGESI